MNHYRATSSSLVLIPGKISNRECGTTTVTIFRHKSLRASQMNTGRLMSKHFKGRQQHKDYVWCLATQCLNIPPRGRSGRSRTGPAGDCEPPPPGSVAAHGPWRTPKPANDRIMFSSQYQWPVVSRNVRLPFLKRMNVETFHCVNSHQVSTLISTCHFWYTPGAFHVW